MYKFLRMAHEKLLMVKRTYTGMDYILQFH